MKKIWIIVANSSLAKIYKSNGQSLVEHEVIYHDESHLHSNELASDRKGKETNRQAFGSDTYEQKTSVKNKEFIFFADSLAQLLEKNHNSGEFTHLYVIAIPNFLGHLRNSLNPNIAKLIQTEIAKDLTHLTPQEIRTYLPYVL